VPEFDPVSPAASSPRRNGLPPAASARFVSGRFLYRQGFRCQVQVSGARFFPTPDTF